MCFAPVGWMPEKIRIELRLERGRRLRRLRGSSAQTDAPAKPARPEVGAVKRRLGAYTEPHGSRRFDLVTVLVAEFLRAPAARVARRRPRAGRGGQAARAAAARLRRRGAAGAGSARRGGVRAGLPPPGR